MPTRWRSDEEILADLAAISPYAKRLVEELTAPRSGRPSNAAVKYRALARMWRNFPMRSGRLKSAARGEFLRKADERITALGLKIGRKIDPTTKDYHSLRNAVAKGEKESANVRARRRGAWRIAPASLAGSRHVVTDPAEHALLQAAARHAYLGTPSPSLIAGL